MSPLEKFKNTDKQKEESNNYPLISLPKQYTLNMSFYLSVLFFKKR